MDKAKSHFFDKYCKRHLEILAAKYESIKNDGEKIYFHIAGKAHEIPELEPHDVLGDPTWKPANLESIFA